ncbi:MAG: biliverdin-producing heme oxygenase [Fluviicoccus sp.]|uniref:biliverdin-producing heme oxygenase n=1 Tax=Fluviicoccus sp. TaxID=2003552 RepID=UPI00271567A2|nr:biliverdin-producing heme oxygenase [Fluviicoccus sp.]MDO8329764.1 biliverdin-producing heme oxygenase [Fluviicoccus sp.]
MSILLNVMEILKQGTLVQHQALHGLPYFTALEGQKLEMASYAGWLAALRVVFEVLEQAFQRAACPGVVSWGVEVTGKRALVEQDWRHFTARGLPEPVRAMLQAHLFAQKIRRRALLEPRSLPGYWYVFEGSMLGGTLLKIQYARCFHLDPLSGGLDYLSCHGLSVKCQWEEFGQKMQAMDWKPSEVAGLAAAANEAFEAMTNIFIALHPLDADACSFRADALNFEAGKHVVTNDIRELEAVFRAGERTWQVFPYCRLRYGERGERFTHSDSAWLTALSENEQVVVDEQIHWLGGLLAVRGMPTWMLESHLHILHDELVTAVPEKHQTYRRLLLAAHRLHQRRQRCIDDACFEMLAGWFDQHADAEWTRKMPGTGGLLVSAVVDERSGIQNAVGALAGWLTDASRFPQAWREAVQELIVQAKAASVEAPRASEPVK